MRPRYWAIGHEMCADNVENHVSTSNSSNDNVNSGICNSHSEYVQLINGRIPDFKSKGMKFGHININSLPVKMDEFHHMCSNIFDVICVNETKCDDSVNDSELVLPGYNLLMHASKAILNLPTSSLHLCSPLQQHRKVKIHHQFTSFPKQLGQDSPLRKKS